MSKAHDLVIIGGGVGGLVTASVAGQLGLDVVLIEREPVLGGDCLNVGCIPSKTLIRSAKVAHTVKNSAAFGVVATGGDADLEQVMGRVQSVIETIRVHDDPERFRGYGVDVRFGEAAFIDAHTVEVNGDQIKGRRFVIATGSRPAVPPISGLNEVPFYTNESIFELKTLPKRLGVIGAGPIGLELAQAYSRLGAQVTVFEAGPRILPKDDPALSQMLLEVLRQEGVDVQLETSINQIAQQAGNIVLYLGQASIEVDALLVAAGRQANTEALALENAGITCPASGTIPVDQRLRTTQRHIFACGDCVGPYPFTHMAEYQAGVIISNAIFRMPKKVDYRAVPWVTYTDPELAQVGYTAEAAAAAGINFQTVQFPFAEVDRALADGATAGELKLHVAKGRIIGASLLGPHAGELIHEIALAVSERIPLRKIASLVHAYPTLAQITKRAAGSYFSPALFSPKTRLLVKWINRLLP